jgi:hypothetical protein
MTDNDALPASRRRRLEQRRRRNHLLGIVSVLAMVAGGATVAAYALTGSPTSSGAPDEVALAGGFPSGDRLPELEEFRSADPARELSHADPLRLWIGGDSLAGALGPALGELTAATGIVRTEVDYKISSGLASNVRNWPQHASQAMTASDPEVVVFMIGTNDAAIVSTHDGDRDGVPDWEPDYRAAVERMMDLLVGDPGSPRTVVWIGGPTLRSPAMDRGVLEVNRVFKEEARERSEHVQYVDAYRLFSDEDGNYTPTVVDVDGDAIRARIDDGVHLTAGGARYLARAVFTLLDARFAITEQSDPQQTIRYTVRDGGESSGSSSRSGARSGSNDHDRNQRSTSTTGSSPTTTSSPPDPPATTVPSTTAAPSTTVAPTTSPPTTAATPTSTAAP